MTITLDHGGHAAGRGARAGFPALLLCLLLSGASGLVYEVAWVRSLELVFGSTTFAVATVLASFMGGLALGAWWMGSRMHRLARFHPLRIYAALEILLGVAGLLVPLALRLQAPIYRALAGTAPESFAAASAARLILCALILLLPTALMGATLPAVSAVAGSGREAGGRVGLLYAVNTFGAVLGCLGAGLVLLPAIGLARTQWLAVALNAAAATGAILIARHAERRPAGEARPDAAFGAGTGFETGAAPGAPSGAPSRGDAPAARLLILAYGLSGFTAMLYEVAWSRLLVLVLGSSTYAYTLMLATFLLGIALGAAAGVRLLRTVPEPRLLAALCQIVVAVSTYLSLHLVHELPYLYHLVYDRIDPSPGGLLGTQWLLAASLMIVPTLGLGAMFPAVVAALDPSGGRAPRVVGRAYAWNTVGAIAGSVAAGFWLVPGAGTRTTLLAGLLINSAIAAALLAGAAGGALPARRARLALAAALVPFAVNAVLAAPRLRPEILSSGVFRYAGQYRGLDRAGFLKRARESRGEILMFEEGLTCTVTVSRTTSLLNLAINGKPDASVPPGFPDAPGAAAPPHGGDLATQILVAQIPLLLAPAAGDVLVIGFGSGVSLGSALRHPVRSADCIELEEAVVRASRHFDFQSGGPLRDPRVRMIVNDARNHLLVSRRTYDIIVSEPSNPWLAGSASLFTRDFFAVAKTRLRPGGLFAQWVQMYELRPEDFLAIVRSFAAVFPDVHLFRVDADAILIGSAAPLPIDLRRIVARGTPPVLADLARAGVRAPEDLLAHYWAGGDDLRRALPRGPINTDDNMLIEFVAPLRMMARDAAALAAQEREMTTLFDGRTAGLIGRLVPPEDDRSREAAFWARTAAAAVERGDGFRALLYAERSLALERTAPGAAAYGGALAALGRGDAAVAWWSRAAGEFPQHAGIHRALALAHLARGDPGGVRHHAGALIRLAPGDSGGRLLLARASRALDDARGVLAALGPSAVAAGTAAERPVFATARAEAPAAGAGPGEADDLLGWALVTAGRHAEAIDPLRRRVRRDPADAGSRRLLAVALLRAGRPVEAAAVARPLEPEAPRLAAERLAQGRARWEAGDAAGARAALEEAYLDAPADGTVAFALARARAGSGDAAGAIDLLHEFLGAHPDRPWAVGYLGELLGRSGRPEAAARLAGRYAALTGTRWEPVDAAASPGGNALEATLPAR